MWCILSPSCCPNWCHCHCCCCCCCCCCWCCSYCFEVCFFFFVFLIYLVDGQMTPHDKPHNDLLVALFTSSTPQAATYNHQWVITTYWWVFLSTAPAATIYNHQHVTMTFWQVFLPCHIQPPTSCEDLLVEILFYFWPSKGIQGPRHVIWCVLGHFFSYLL